MFEYVDLEDTSVLTDGDDFDLEDDELDFSMM